MNTSEKDAKIAALEMALQTAHAENAALRAKVLNLAAAKGFLQGALMGMKHQVSDDCWVRIQSVLAQIQNDL